MVIANIDPLMAVDIPHGWDLIPLGKCVSEKLSYGVNAPAISYNRCYPCYIRITDITEDGQYDDSDKKSVAITFEEKERRSLKIGDIVLARTGASTGKSYLYNEEDGELVYAGFLIKAAVNVRSYNPRFVFGQLRTRRYWTWVAATSMRSGQPGINGKEYAAFLIPIAPKKEQDKIAETLLKFDTYIDDLTELIEKKRGIREGVLEDLMSGRTRLKGFVDNWQNEKLLNHVQLVQGLTYTPEDVSISGTLVLRSSNIQNKRLSLEDNVYVRTSVPHEKMICAGDILICVRNGSADLIGKNCVLPDLINTTFGAFMSVLRGDTTGFIAKVFDSSIVQEQVRSRTSATINQITKKDFESIMIPWPSEDEQKAIASVLATMDEEIETLEIERDKMIQIREGAMDDLLTGRVRLSV